MEKREKMVEEVAEIVHEDLRRSYGNKPHIRATKDETWIKKYDTDQIDLGSFNYSQLPLDWQNERKTGAQIAVDAVLEAEKNNELLDNEFIERVSLALHFRWLDRNYNRATDTQKSSYAELSEKEKEKDRIFVRTAIKIYKQASN